MEHRYIGKSGLRVSPIGLGTMTFGLAADKKEAFAIMDKAYAAGVNFFDTAEIYPVPPSSDLAGTTEMIVGEWMAGKPRDSLIIATKVAGAANGWFVPPIRHGLTAIDRHHIRHGIEGSLRRLKTDYIDLYQVHWPDTLVPVEESMEALDALVREGKVRYLGTSNDTAYGLTKANYTAKYRGFKRFESIQNNFSILNRRFLDSLAAVCRGEGVSLLPYSPLAGGVATGKYNRTILPPDARFTRYRTSPAKRLTNMAERFLNERTLASVARYEMIAQERGMDVTTMVTAWSMDFDFVASTLIGATRAAQLDATLAAMEVKLSDEIKAACDAVHRDILYPMG
jgi:aryl-alcohol dehydrogenase-like predicted oxidoreductase